MRYYIIINGVNSLTIPGLAIRTLPPISKPAMRNLREEIDGRDGDITTELGYGAYDRILEIGLYGAYDIDRIISFFNTKGTIIFSDEPDKYYNFEIVDKIDYTKLVKFRTASINIHCQPFKYPTEEEPEVEEYEYVEDTGEALTLNNTAEAILNKIELIGNTEQTQYTGSQLYDFSNVARTGTKNGATYTINDDGSITITGTPTEYTSWYFRSQTLPAGTYYASQELSTNANVFMQALGDYAVIGTGRSFTINEAKSGVWYLVINNSEAGHTLNVTMKPMLNTGTTAKPYEPYVGGIPSPNPNYPQDIHVVSGDNTIEITGRNLCTGETEGYYINQAGTNAGKATNDSGVVIETNGGYYTISTTEVQTRYRVGLGNTLPALNSTAGITSSNLKDGTSDTIVKNTAGYKYLFVNATDLTKIQIETGQTKHDFEEYQSQSLPLSLGNLEMASIPNTNYKDVFVKEGETWYKRKAIGKKILDGTENTWSKLNLAFQLNQAFPNDGYVYGVGVMALSSHFTYHYYPSSITSLIQNGEFGWNSGRFLTMRNDNFSTADDFKTWLGTTKPTLYYILTTPTDIEITNEALIDQLEAIKNAISYNGQTNVSQTNNDLPFILDISALELGSDHLVINNSGNIYAKPTIDIEGTGVVDIYLNDVQILEADLSETNNIVIDTEAMEAYNPDTNALANRQVTGDYSKIKLEPGENDLRFSGDLSKATVTKYKRWL